MFCCGQIIVCGMDSKKSFAGLIIPAGFMLMMLSFELVCVPVILFTSGSNFRYVCFIYTPVLLILAALGAYRGVKSGMIADSARNMASFVKNLDIEQKITWCIFIVLTVVLLVFMETRVIFDGDDAYYVAQSVTTWQNGTMYSVNPYNGRAAAIDMRHALAAFPIWNAYIGKIFGIHPTILCHSILPIILIPVALIVFGDIGRIVLKDRREMLPYFMIFMTLILMFGRVSIYTSETFLISRTWQGKAVTAGIMIPAVFLAYAVLYDDESPNDLHEWGYLFIIDAAAGIFSSLAVELISILIAAGGAVYLIRQKSIKKTLPVIACLAPGVLYMMLYLYFTYLSWR